MCQVISLSAFYFCRATIIKYTNNLSASQAFCDRDGKIASIKPDGFFGGAESVMSRNQGGQYRGSCHWHYLPDAKVFKIILCLPWYLWFLSLFHSLLTASFLFSYFHHILVEHINILTDSYFILFIMFFVLISAGFKWGLSVNGYLPPSRLFQLLSIRYKQKICSNTSAPLKRRRLFWLSMLVLITFLLRTPLKPVVNHIGLSIAVHF